MPDDRGRFGAHQDGEHARAVRRHGGRHGAAVSAQQRKGMGDGGVFDAAARDGETHAARSHQGPPLGAHARDPAADRAFDARGGGYDGAGRAHGDHRLRRDPGRWRHAHGVGHGRFRGDGDGLPATSQVRRAEEQSAARLHRGHQRGTGRRRADARPLLRRGLAGRCGYERGDDRRGPIRRSAGHGGARRRSTTRRCLKCWRWRAPASRNWC